MRKLSPAMIYILKWLDAFLLQTHSSHGGTHMVSEHLLTWAIMPKRTSCLAIILTLFSSLVYLDVSYAAGRVFYDGFEDGTTNAWQAEAGRGKCPVVSASLDGITGPKAGTKMVQCNYQTDGNWATLTLNTGSIYNDELFIRMWYRPDTDINRTGGYQGQPTIGIASFKLMRFFQQVPYHDMFEVAGHPQQSNNNAGNPNDSDAFPTYWGGASGDRTNVSSGWHKIEYYIKQSAGAFKVWHDGLLIRNNSGYNYMGMKWTSFFLQSNGDSGTTDNNNHWYVDEFEIYSDMASGATGAMYDATITVGGSGDATPPASPVNLRVQ